MSKRRELNLQEEQIIDELYRRKMLGFIDTHAYCTTTKLLQMRRWNKQHPVDQNTTIYDVPSGTTLKIVMISRLGDVGLTDQLDAVCGYGLRVMIDSDEIKDIRRHP